jgi:mRNA-degrading endonuclease RelE of RelBE toxin-antitoxin system
VGRPVVPYEPTWLDKTFQKELNSLNSSEQGKCTRLLAELIDALKSCRHPTQDSNLQKWHPTSYKGVVAIKGGHLAEYRLTGTMRVIAFYFEDRETILLVVATIKHDHDRMKRLLRDHGRYLLSYP